MKAAPLNAAHLTMMVHVTKVKVQWASQTGSLWGVWQCILYETEYDVKSKLLQMLVNSLLSALTIF